MSWPSTSRIIPSGFSFFKFIGQRRLRKILVADRAHEAINRVRAHGCRAAVARGRIRAAVYHRVAHLHAGWKAVNDQPARLCAPESQSDRRIRGQIGLRGHAALRSVALRATAPASSVLRSALVADHQRARPKDLRRQLRFAQQIAGADLHQHGRRVRALRAVGLPPARPSPRNDCALRPAMPLR